MAMRALATRVGWRMNMTLGNTIECVFYSHSWSVYCLEQMGITGSDDVILIELAKRSTLAMVVGDTSRNRLGVAGLLEPSCRLESLSEVFDDIQQKLVLASHQELSITALTSAVGLLAHKKIKQKRIVLLVSILEAQELAPAWQQAQRFHVLWDVADYPNLALAELGEVLSGQACLSDETWGGLHFYQHKQRQMENATSLLEEYQAVLSNYPALSVAS